MACTYVIEGQEVKLRDPLKAIRANCLVCTCGSISEIRECNIANCPVWPYRMGNRAKDKDGELKDHMNPETFGEDWGASMLPKELVNG